MKLESFIRDVPDFPKKGIIFKDITPLLASPECFQSIVDLLEARVRPFKPDGIVAVESRGFLFGGALAAQMKLPLQIVRKPGKLPYKTVSVEYELEYGTDRIEMHVDAVGKGDKVLLVDDLIATGGTAEAAVKLIEKMGGSVVECCFAIDLPDLGGRKRLEKLGQKVHALCEFEGD